MLQYIQGNFNCSNNQKKSLEDFADNIQGEVIMTYNHLLTYKKTQIMKKFRECQMKSF